MLTWGDAVTIHHPMSSFRWMVDVGPDTVMQFDREIVPRGARG